MREVRALSSLVLSLVVLLLCVSEKVGCVGEKKLLGVHKFQWKRPNGGYPSCVHRKSSVEKGATILELNHRDYCFGKIADWNKYLKKRLILDDAHVHSLESRFKDIVFGSSKDVSATQIPLTSGIRLQTLNYIVTVELGGRNLTVIVDTGSDLTWVQCQPCRSCYNQQEPIFDPSSSSSYQQVFCNSSTCQILQSATGNTGVCGSSPPTCNYVVNYGDGSFSRGELGLEDLSFGSTPVKKFVFGCGHDNKGLFGGASGLMGLARSEISVVSQTSGLFGGVFSYCLPSTEAGGSGSLAMGGDSTVFKNFTPISYTRMVPNPQLSNFYFVNVTGISVGNVPLQSPGFASDGVLIDSGTVITRLAPSVYSAFRSEFLKQFSGFPNAPGFSILNTCFNLSAYQEVEIPTIKFHFEGGAELNVDVTGVFYFVKSDASQVCLAFASLAYEDEIGIIGNYQQKNQRVVYDTKQSKLGFAGETCNFL